MKILKTNEDLVRNLMNYSPYGALAQGFIMQAIDYYCQEVINQKEKTLAEEEKNKAEGRISLISPHAWIGVAEDIKRRTDEFYNR